MSYNYFPLELKNSRPVLRHRSLLAQSLILGHSPRRTCNRRPQKRRCSTQQRPSATSTLPYSQGQSQRPPSGRVPCRSKYQRSHSSEFPAEMEGVTSTEQGAIQL